MRRFGQGDDSGGRRGVGPTRRQTPHPSLPSCVCLMYVSFVCLDFWGRISVISGQGVATEQPTASPTIGAPPSPVHTCDAVTECEHHPTCAECLTAVRPYSSSPSISMAVVGHTQETFFTTLRLAPACAPHRTPPSLLNAALEALLPDGNRSCHVRAGFAVGYCQLSQYQCFVAGPCSQCLAALYAEPTRTAAVLATPACQTAGFGHGRRPIASACFSFPRCSFSKERCLAEGNCSACWADLRRNDAAVATHACRDSPSAEVLDSLVVGCVQNDPLGCSFWQQRCFQSADCTECMAAMDDASSPSTITTGAMTASCTRALASPASLTPLTNFIDFCPANTVSFCNKLVFFCVLSNPVCARCVAHTATAAEAPLCDGLLNASGFGITTACRECPGTVRFINRLVLATSVVGGVSVVACLVVVIVLVAHGRDRVSMRDRIVIGLMLSNAAYSSANAIPLNRLRTGVANCGQLALSFEVIRIGRAWWFFGKVGGWVGGCSDVVAYDGPPLSAFMPTLFEVPSSF
jgi:hypothetical protein